MNRDSVKLRLWLGGLATAGMVAGHQLGYLLAIPGADHRQVLLERTGHAHWGAVGAIALGLLIANLYHAALGRLRSFDGRFGDDRRILWHSASRLFVLQPAAFVVLEMLERIIARQPITQVLSESPFIFGLACQVLFALAGALLLVLVLRAVAAVARRLAPRPRSASDALRPTDRNRIAFLQVLALSRCAPRGPPAPLLNS